MPDIKYAQTEAVDKGSLKVEVLANRTRRPIEGAKNHHFLFGRAGFHGGGGKRR